MSKLQQYRDSMEAPMEQLAITLTELSANDKSFDDHELVELATKKLRTLHKLCLSAGIQPGILKAVMEE